MKSEGQQTTGVASSHLSMFAKLKRGMRRVIAGLRHPSLLPTLIFLFAGRLEARLPDRPKRSPGKPELDASTFRLLTSNCESSKIPARIFQTWKSRTDIPSNYRYWRSSFAEQNLDFEMILWDDSDNLRFIKKNFPWFEETYNIFPREIFRADAVRPFFLFLYGGFYADMDSECLRSLEPLRQHGDVLLGRMGSDRGFDQSIPNALMASRPYELFWLLVILLMMERAHEAGESIDALMPETFTGPIMLKKAVDIYLASTEESLRRRCQKVIANLPESIQLRLHFGSLKLLDPDVWYPVDWTNPFHRMLRRKILRSRRMLDVETARRLFPKAFLVTYWSHSWSRAAVDELEDF